MAKRKTVPSPTPGQVMRRVRTDGGLTQTDLAKALRVSQAAISGFETGRPSKGGPWLSGVKLWAFSKLFEVEPGSLGLSEHEACPTCGRPL